MLRQMAMNNLIAMAKHGGSTERIIAMMVEKLKDSDKLFRGMAVEALSRSAKEVRKEITTALIKSLEDPDANVRCRAVKALRPACVGESHPTVVAALSGMLQDENPFVQDAAIDNLQYAILHASFDVRSSLLSSVHKGIRTAAVDSYMDEILAGGDQALDLVIGMLQDSQFQVRMAALRVIATLLTTRDTKVTKDHEAKMKAEGREHDNVPPVKAGGPQIDKTLGALMSTLGDQSPDIRTEVLRRLSCNTATLNQKVFKAVLELLADEVHLDLT
jgi:HEAT repeat protein